MDHQKGFSLIELIIVVLIIGIIAAIAVPNLLASRRTANEATTISALRTIHSAEIIYQSTAGGGDFGSFTELNAQGLIHSVLSNATNATNAKNGYIFTLVATPVSSGRNSVFECDAYPVTHSTVSNISATGTRRFFIVESGVIYANTTNAVISVTSSIDRTVSGASPIDN